MSTQTITVNKPTIKTVSVAQQVVIGGGGGGGGGGLLPDYTQTGVLAVDTVFMADSSSARTRAFPAGTDEDHIGIKDDGGLAGTNTITIQPNGAELIMGVNADFTITTNNGYAEFIYKAADTDWRLVV